MTGLTHFDFAHIPAHPKIDDYEKWKFDAASRGVEIYLIYRHGAKLSNYTEMEEGVTPLFCNSNQHKYLYESLPVKL